MTTRRSRVLTSRAKCHKAKRPRRFERLESRNFLAADFAAAAYGPEIEFCQCPVCTGLLAAVEPEPAAMVSGPAAASLASLPLLSSNPSAAAKLFLDFDGHLEASWSFRTNVTTPSYDQDGNSSTFSSGELSSIHEIWARVAEDFAPFNVDVTTIDPGHQRDREVAVIAVGGNYTDWYGSAAAGVAFVGGFSNFSPNVGYAFSQSLGNNPRSVAEVASHEAGHLFGLSHQARWSGGSTPAEPYHSGNGAWAPIMGVSYSATRSTWHNGTTAASSSSFQDDIAIIAGATNGFGYKLDDFGSTRVTASALPGVGSSVSLSGLLGRSDDQDVWSFSTSGGAVSFELVGAALGTNLDAVLELWDSAGAVVAADSPTGSLGARLTVNLGSGNFYLAARGMGDYGDVGQYTITGSLAASDTTPPTADILDVTPDPRNMPAGIVSVTFSEPVTGVNLSDFSLIRNGSPVSLTGVALNGSGPSYTLDLSSVSSAAGSYVLRLSAGGSGIADGSGNALSADATDSWLTDTTAPLADIVDVTPDPRSTAAGFVSLTFNEPVSGLDQGDFVLTRDGAVIALAAGSLSGAGASYTLNLSSVTSTAGVYVLRLVAAGSNVRDAAGNLLAANGEDSWTTDTSPPTAQFAAPSPSVRNLPVGSLTVTLNEPITGLDLGDFQLTRDGVQVSLSGVTLSGSEASYALDLISVSDIQGSYLLRLAASGSAISDSAGNALAVDAVVAWQTDTTAPTADILDVTPDPRGTAAGVVAIRFSEPVGGLDVSDLRLTRDGAAVSLASVMMSGSGSNYSIDLNVVTSLPGSYQLQLVSSGSSISDAAGNLLVIDAVDSWLMESATPIADIVDVNPDPRNTGVGVVTVTFSETVTGVDLADFQLLRNGNRVPIPAASLAGSGARYTLDLSSLGASDGVYSLTLVAGGSDVRDLAGNPLSTDAEDTWIVDTQSPTPDIVDVSPDPRANAAGLVRILFSEPISGLDFTDFALVRDGSLIPLTGSVLSGGAQSYTLDLSGLTALGGIYTLRLAATGSGIRDSAGNLLVTDAVDTWRTDTTVPTAGFEAVSPNPRNNAVGSIGIPFSEPVSGVDLADFALTRDGVPVLLTSGMLSGSGTTYTFDLSSVSTLGGAYELRLVAAGSEIVDAAGNALATAATVHWLTDTSVPAVDIADISPDPRNIAAGLVTLAFSEPVTGVDLGDFVLTRDGSPVALRGAALAGSEASYTLDLSSVSQAPGSYVLELRAAGSEVRDAAGNLLVTSATDEWLMDTFGTGGDIVDVSPDPRHTPVALVTIRFNEPVSGVDMSDFHLNRNGTSIPLVDATLTGQGDTYTIDLTTYTRLAGQYEFRLTASTSGIRDAGGNPLTTDISDSWEMDTVVPTAGIIDVAPNVRQASVGMVTLSFNETVLGVDLADFTLTRDGATVSLAGVAFTGNGSSYSLDLSSINLPGLYVLRLAAAGSGITDLAGNTLVNDTHDSWLIDVASPTAEIVDSPGGTTNSAVGIVTIRFSEAISGLDKSDIALSRDGASIPIDHVTLSGSGALYTLDLTAVTTLSGNYQLRVIALGSGISDSAGNTLVADATAQWLTDTPAPLAGIELDPTVGEELNGWHNYGEPLNVDGIKGITAQDALTIINELNARQVSSGSTGRLSANRELISKAYLDVNNDHYITAADCLAVINYLNAGVARLLAEESLSQSAAIPSAARPDESFLTDEMLELLAADSLGWTDGRHSVRRSS